MDSPTNQIAEIEAMRAVAEALAGMEPEAIGRILTWAASAFSAKVAPVRASVEPEQMQDQEVVAPATSLERNFDSLAELFEVTNPTTEAERVLVGSYWSQMCNGEDDVDSYSVNMELKHLGHGIGNITRAFGKLIDQRPALMMQVRKSGSSQQARKRYRVTNEGLKQVKRMFTEGSA